MALTKITAAVSDADVLIKLCKAGYIDILGDVIETLFVPVVVLREVESKITDGKDIINLKKVCSQDWFVVISLEDLNPAQKLTYASFIATYSNILDRGELHATALASEIGIDIILSDDHSAKNIIEYRFQKGGMAYWEVLYYYGKLNGMPLKQLETIHNAVNQVVDKPIGVPFKKLMRRAEGRISELFNKK